MSAHGFIAEIFSRVQDNVPGNQRFISEGQYNKLRELIGADEEGGAVKQGMNGGFRWKPSGRWSYVFSVEIRGTKTLRRITRMASPDPSAAGTLFG